MTSGIPQVPAGSGQHPIVTVVLAANAMARSREFYASVFGWQFAALTPEIMAAVMPEGPTLTLRGAVAEGFQGSVPFIGVTDVPATLARVVALGGEVERAPWQVPMAGTMARFRDPSGTIYGLTSGLPPAPLPRIPIPLGGNPRPRAGVVCSLEMYAKDGGSAGAFFAECFGWNSLPTMPSFVAFDAGAGIGGVFQSHTPALPGVVYISSDDVNATLAAVVGAGGAANGEPMAVPGMGTFGYFKDPSGTIVGLIGP
jgi:uncharacterized protein